MTAKRIYLGKLQPHLDLHAWLLAICGYKRSHFHSMATHMYGSISFVVLTYKICIL